MEVVLITEVSLQLFKIDVTHYIHILLCFKKVQFQMLALKFLLQILDSRTISHGCRGVGGMDVPLNFNLWVSADDG
jgi:hypothetical protein